MGNTRLSYGDDGEHLGALFILEENNYYPFGLKHQNYNMGQMDYVNGGGGVTLGSVSALEYKYKYNGNEYQDEFGLNWYDYGARNYDPATGRWMAMDPLAETSRRFSPYAYALNNPVRFIDPDGMMADDTVDMESEMGEGRKASLSGDNEGIDVTGTPEAKEAYVKEVNKSLGGNQEITFGDPLFGGNPNSVILSPTETQVPLTEAQQAFSDEYSAVVNSPSIAKQEAVISDVSTTVGNWTTGKIDMADIAQFDAAGPGASSSAGALIHETVEQLNKAQMGLGPMDQGDANNFQSAHGRAVSSENKVNGNTRQESPFDHTPDVFIEKNGSRTRQIVIPHTNGTINIMKG